MRASEVIAGMAGTGEDDKNMVDIGADIKTKENKIKKEKKDKNCSDDDASSKRAKSKAKKNKKGSDDEATSKRAKSKSKQVKRKAKSPSDSSDSKPEKKKSKSSKKRRVVSSSSSSGLVRKPKGRSEMMEMLMLQQKQLAMMALAAPAHSQPGSSNDPPRRSKSDFRDKIEFTLAMGDLTDEQIINEIELLVNHEDSHKDQDESFRKYRDTVKSLWKWAAGINEIGFMQQGLAARWQSLQDHIGMAKGEWIWDDPELVKEGGVPEEIKTFLSNIKPAGEAILEHRKTTWIEGFAIRDAYNKLAAGVTVLTGATDSPMTGAAVKDIISIFGSKVWWFDESVKPLAASQLGSVEEINKEFGIPHGRATHQDSWLTAFKLECYGWEDLDAEWKSYCKKEACPFPKDLVVKAINLHQNLYVQVAFHKRVWGLLRHANPASLGEFHQGYVSVETVISAMKQHHGAAVTVMDLWAMTALPNWTGKGWNPTTTSFAFVSGQNKKDVYIFIKDRTNSTLNDDGTSMKKKPYNAWK